MNLVITEKPSVAAAISAVLNAKERKDGFFEGNGYIVSWCVGHLIEFARPEAYDEKYSKWRYADLPIIPHDWKFAVTKDKAKQLKIISELMKRTDVQTVICATDAGREGELIFRLVYEYCGCKKPIQRLWISSLEEKAIEDGFRSLKDGTEYEKLYQSALCRSQADWIVGMNATRLFSVLYYGQTLNIGRVMTPTLALIVEREKAINAFIKEPFYTVELDCGSFVANSDKMKDVQAAESVRALCDGKTAYITGVEKQEKNALPPKLYDLTTLQREANRLFGFTSQQTLDYAQSLYEKKLATYPRTDSRYLTEDMAAGIPALVRAVSNALPFTKDVKLSVDSQRVINNSKVSDHHAIIPTQTMTSANLLALSAGERDIMYMIAVRLLCAVGDKHVYNETTVTVECENYTFSAKGKNVLYGGWKAIEQAFMATLKSREDENTEENKALPVLTNGQSFENISAGLREGFTSPPKHYTEDTLLSAMENAGAEEMPEDAERKGLGTPATRAGIIEKLVRTDFIERKEASKVKNLLPTEKGVNLITILPEIIKSPLLTAEWESKLKQVERGELSGSAFLMGITEMINGLIKTHTAPKDEFLSLFPPPTKQGEAIGVCPRCGANVHESKKGYFCEKRACQFALWKDNKFFTSKKKELTKEIAAALLKEGRISMTGLYSERKKKTYDAEIVLDDTGEKFVNFKLEFKNKKRK